MQTCVHNSMRTAVCKCGPSVLLFTKQCSEGPWPYLLRGSSNMLAPVEALVKQIPTLLLIGCRKPSTLNSELFLSFFVLSSNWSLFSPRNPKQEAGAKEKNNSEPGVQRGRLWARGTPASTAPCALASSVTLAPPTESLLRATRLYSAPSALPSERQASLCSYPHCYPALLAS